MELLKSKSIKPMNKETIEIALNSALSLLSNEVDTIEFEDLKNEYIAVIDQLEIAIKEVNKDS